jgi:succinyl-diaminopimelate desuccinylase
MPDTAAASFVDPVPLAQALLRCPSITPVDAGVMDVLTAALTPLGFTCRRMKFDDTENLYAKRGSGAPHLMYAGHTDVVPPGDLAAWSVDPFAAEVADGKLVARGTVDMKGSIAAFIAAVASLPKQDTGAISLLIAGDEEGVAINGTIKVLEALVAEGETWSHALVGEPSSAEVLGDMIKNGRRGSFNCAIEVFGKQGHVAYPHLSLNPVPVLLDLLQELRTRNLDDGAPGFDPSRLEITSIDVGDSAFNVIPAKAKAKLNVRFNSNHTGQAMLAWVNATAAHVAARYPGARIDVNGRATGEAFYSNPGPFTDLLLDACEKATGRRPVLSTTGGTSDARFINKVCPVAELGLVNQMAHKVDEFVTLDELHVLTRIYARVIGDYFEKFA